MKKQICSCYFYICKILSIVELFGIKLSCSGCWVLTPGGHSIHKVEYTILCNSMIVIAILPDLLSSYSFKVTWPLLQSKQMIQVDQNILSCESEVSHFNESFILSAYSVLFSFLHDKLLIKLIILTKNKIEIQLDFQELKL